MKRILISLVAALFACAAYATGNGTSYACQAITGTYSAPTGASAGPVISTQTVLVPPNSWSVSGTWDLLGSDGKTDCHWTVNGTYTIATTPPEMDITMTGAGHQAVCGNSFEDIFTMPVGTPGCQTFNYNGVPAMHAACKIPTGEGNGTAPAVTGTTVEFQPSINPNTTDWTGRVVAPIYLTPGGTCSPPALQVPSGSPMIYVGGDGPDNYADYISFDTPTEVTPQRVARATPCTGIYTETPQIDCSDGSGGVSWTPFSGGGLTVTRTIYPALLEIKRGNVDSGEFAGGAPQIWFEVLAVLLHIISYH